LNTNFKQSIVTGIAGIAEFINITEGRYQITVQVNIIFFPKCINQNFNTFFIVGKRAWWI
jgi:hypothetical protein